MIHLNVLLTVQDPANVEQVAKLLVDCCRLSRLEPGCVRFEVYHSQADETRFILNEHWESEEALDAHRQGQAFTEIYTPQVLPLVTREPHPTTLFQP